MKHSNAWKAFRAGQQYRPLVCSLDTEALFHSPLLLYSRIDKALNNHIGREHIASVPYIQIAREFGGSQGSPVGVSAPTSTTTALILNIHRGCPLWISIHAARVVKRFRVFGLYRATVSVCICVQIATGSLSISLISIPAPIARTQSVLMPAHWTRIRMPITCCVMSLFRPNRFAFSIRGAVERLPQRNHTIKFIQGGIQTWML